MSAGSGEFKTLRPALPRSVGDRNPLGADGEWRLGPAGVGPRPRRPWRCGRHSRARSLVFFQGSADTFPLRGPFPSGRFAPMAQFAFDSDLHSLLQLDTPIPNAPPARWQRKAKEASGPAPSPMRAANRSHTAGRTPGRTPGQWVRRDAGREHARLTAACVSPPSGA